MQAVSMQEGQIRQPRESQFTGCLIGQCLGDALGAVVEGYPPDMCRTYVDQILKTPSVGEPRREGYPVGQYTDDSQLARELLRSYVACRRFDPPDYARRIAAIFEKDEIVGRGFATDEAARRLRHGVPWEEAGARPPSAGNGSAMRAAPVGLIFFDDPAMMVQAAHDQGRITHQDRRCSAGAVAVAGAVALAVREERFELESFVLQLANWTHPFDPVLAEALGQMPRWVPSSPEEAVAEISRVGVTGGYTGGWEGISPFVTSSVLWSLFSFLKTPDDYWEAICTAIAVGGDVDTTAAMTGAISGARVGLEGIPSPLARRVNDNGTWKYDDLVDLARQCYQIRMGK